MKGLTDIPGIRVGHASDCRALTGCTVVLCGPGTIGGVDVRGWASGTSEAGTLDPGHVAGEVHAVVLAGGSAFGLEAASGVRRWLEARGIGYRTGAGVVPIVPCAILYDLAVGDPSVRPTREMGEAAAAAATDEPVAEGAVGAGTGATVGKLFGMRQAMKGGVGSAIAALPGGVLVAAMAVVNAFGDVRDPATGAIVAGARRAPDSAEFAGTEDEMRRGASRDSIPGPNTTLAVVATNARLTRVGATKLARMAGLGMARTIYPVHTTWDGDVVFALSCGELTADLDALGAAAAGAVAQALLRGVLTAPTLGGVPGLAR